ncbi:MAG: hypothetical protein O2854_04430 [Chloroflexi bacterium]|nr:hypothetical protein [Chloroflexota bacterium]
MNMKFAKKLALLALAAIVTATVTYAITGAEVAHAGLRWTGLD